jgi:exopolysaccharide production protein ExoQ
MIAFLVVFVLACPSPFGSLNVLAFLVFGLLLMARRPVDAIGEVQRYWWIYAIPFWCIATVFWSQYPDLSLRHGIQLLFTVAIGITVGSRLSPLNFLKICFLAFLIAGLASAAVGNVRPDGAWVGLYGSKNAFAGAASLLALLAFALAFDRSLGWIWHLSGLFGLLLGLVLLVKAGSAGALASTVVAISFGVFLVLLRVLVPQHRLALLVVLGLLSATVLVSVLDYRIELWAFLLDLSDKDPTMTGRIELWEAAFGEIRRSPLLGQGFQAFWVQGNPLAEDLWAMFFIESRGGFNFHNTYISNAVEIGLVGMAIQAFAFFLACFFCLVWAIRHPVSESVFFAIFLLRQLVLSFSEVVFFFQFDIVTVLSIAALVFGMRARATETPNVRPVALATMPADPHDEASTA